LFRFRQSDSSSNCTPFSGTSAACPIGAGVVALILSVHPNLTWLEVQYIIIEGSTPNFGMPILLYIYFLLFFK
jgi:kexin